MISFVRVNREELSVPMSAESLEEGRKKYKKYWNSEIFDEESIDLGLAQCPSDQKDRFIVFDNGIKLLPYQCRKTTGELILFCSAGCLEGKPLSQKLDASSNKGEAATFKAWLSCLGHHYNAICLVSERDDWKLSHVNAGGIAVFYIEL